MRIYRYPRLQAFLESMLPGNRGIQMFPEDNIIFIGYFKIPASMADLSKKLPEKMYDKLEKQYLKTGVTVWRNYEKRCPMTNRKMNFTALSIPSLATSNFRKEIESVFPPVKRKRIRIYTIYKRKVVSKTIYEDQYRDHWSHWGWVKSKFC
jgi:hypothetical protein